jgi:hypothetical protein
MKNLFSKIFTKNQAAQTESVNSSAEQAVLIYLDGIGLPSEIYQKYDMATLEDQIVAVLEEKGNGEYDGNETGEKETVIFLYGPNAEDIFSEIQEIINRYPLCQNSRVVIRHGKPGADQREVRIGTK